jgi:hypothetical protein
MAGSDAVSGEELAASPAANKKEYKGQVPPRVSAWHAVVHKVSICLDFSARKGFSCLKHNENYVLGE